MAPPDSLIAADAEGAELLRARIRHLTDAVADARQRAETAEARLRLLEASTAWRATAPARRLAARYPSAARWARRGARLLWWTARGELPRRLRVWQAARAASPARRASRLVLPRAEAPLVTVIIPTYGQAACTLRCLAAIAAHRPSAAVEIVVIDDASGDPAVAALARVRGLRFVAQPRNLGYLLTCNAAAAAARGAYVMLLNNDTEVREGWLDALLGALERDPRAAAAGSKLLYPDGRLQEAGGIIWSDGSGWNHGRGDDPDRPEYNYVREADWCSAASLLVRREAWDALGGFDPVYAPAYCEDSDLAFRLRARGKRVLYVPTSVVVHHEGITHGTDPASGLKAFQTRNQHILRRRYHGVLAAGHYPNGSDVARARDRARDRRVTLVLDHLVPEPDRDAGSRTMDAFLTALQDAGDVVKFWPQNRHRTPRYAALLEARGIEVLYGDMPFAEWLVARGGAIDRVLASRPAVADALLPDLLGLLRVPVVYYGHDLHHARLRAQAALLPEGGPRDALLAEAARQEAAERRAWALADVVLYPSEDEAACVRALRPGTDARAVVPYAFDSFDPPRGPAGRAGLLMVAGFAHTPNVDAAVWLAEAVMPRVRAAVPGAVLTLAGSLPSPRVRALAGQGVRIAADLDDAALAAAYDAARVAVVPLRYGAGVKMKTVEALRAGLPAVATSVGVQGLPGARTVLAVRDDADGFAAAVIDLLRDDAAWRARSAAQLAYAAARFSRAALSASLLGAFEPARVVA